MSEPIEKKLISAVSAAWNEVAPNILGCPSTLSLLASREVLQDGLGAALAVAVTWSCAFVVSCSGAIGGVLICLFKTEEGDDIDRRVKQEIDGVPKPGGRALVTRVVEAAAVNLAAADSEAMTFSPAAYIDLTIDEKRLAAIVGDSIQIGTFSLSLGDETNTQALVLYAPNGLLDAVAPSVESSVPTMATPANPPAPVKETPASPSGSNAEAAPSLAASSRRGSEPRRVEAAPRNMERLLEVELDVVVRFGVTNIPLREVVRMGVGTMIELNRAVDEPVELLVNGRPLARGEVVVVDGYYGVRITEIGAVSDRASML